MSEHPDEAPHRYDAQLANQIEPYWQDWWAKTGAFETPNPSGALAGENAAGQAKLYVLDMFPYPSGAGLHVGHPLGYIGTDVYARFRRMRGDNVLHPFGYDAFGLPAEQYAIETGTHPRLTTEANIVNMRRQLRRLGLAHDPRREFATTDPTYYRWTQWIFLRLFGSWFDPARGAARPIAELEDEFEAGTRAPEGEANPGGRPWAALSASERRRLVDGYRLAYVAEAPVNWCPGLGTVLANEEVTAEGRSAIGNYPVFRRPLRQWMLRITAYAERLLDDLDLLDWPESIKTSQRNWIGRSEGANVHFPVVGADERITVFTTRPDTLFGATYMVLAPEHPLVDTLVADAWPEGTPEAWRGDGLAHDTPARAVGAYREAASRISERERMADTGRKTGVFSGGYAVNPTNGQRIPVFVADYVLLGYGTGAIMAVPAHDQRDFDFARTFGLPMTCVIAPSQAWLDDHDVAPAAAADPWSWPEAFAGDGVAVNSANEDISLDGLGVDHAKRTIVGWLERTGAGSGQVSYRLRDWLFSRQRYWGEPFPIVWDDEDLPHALPEEALPVELPEMEDFRPAPAADDDDSEPQPPLARATDWATVTIDLGDGPRVYRRELNTMPQWAGSCWYYLRFLDPANDRALVDPAIERYWTQRPGEAPAVAPVDLYVGGVEHAVLHLLYARFWHKVLFDLGDVQTPEPFARLFNQGYILAAAYQDERGLYVPAAEVVEHPDGALTYQGRPVTRVHGKMGKSLKNSVTPDEICADYGADTLRLYEMAMGPFDMDRPWSTEGLAGSYRFLQRLWRNLVDEASGELRVADVAVEADLERAMHRTIDVVARDIDGLRFNTAIARLMEFNNALTGAVRASGRCPRVIAETLVLLVAPLAPHVAEELWHRLGHDASVAEAAYPVADPELLRVEEITLPVGVDGKVRFTITVPAEADEATVREAATSRPELARWLTGKRIARVIVVPGRIVNVTTRPA